MVWPFTRKTSTAAADPNERCVALQLESDGKPAVWLINVALDGCAEHETFAWHLRIDVEMLAVVEPIRFPTKEEQVALTALRAELEATLKSNDNARFLGSITEEGIRTLLYRVRDPELANSFLSEFVAKPTVERAMQFAMHPDGEWAMAHTYLDAVRESNDPSVPKARLERRDGKVAIVSE
jgi:hypothetical protein